MSRILFLALACLASHLVHAQSAPPVVRGSVDYTTTLGYGTDRLESTVQGYSVDGALGHAMTAANVAVDAVALRDAYDALDTTDVQYDPAELERGGPQVPTSCNGDEACQACYAPAIQSINHNRLTLGKAWALARSTIVFTEQAVAFGDSIAGLHPSAGVGWNFGVKQDVNKSLDTMRSTYARRYRDFITALERGLRELGDCEARFYDQRDWYERYGFMYLAFLEAKYEHPDP
jgi:hypothetical protein